MTNFLIGVTLQARHSWGSQNWLNKSVSKVLGWRHTAEELETPRGQEIIQNVSDQLSSRATAIVQLLPQLPEQVSSLRDDLLHHTQPVQPPKLHKLDPI